MKELIKDIPKDFINSNKHIRVIKGCLGGVAVLFAWYFIFLLINPGITFNVQELVKDVYNIKLPFKDALSVTMSMWLLPLLVWILINVASFSPKKIAHSFIALIMLCVSSDALSMMGELNVSKQYYNHYLLMISIVTIIFIFAYGRIRLVNIATMKRSYQKGIIAHGDEVGVDIVLGKKSRVAFLKKLYKATTYFYYDGNVCYECIDNGLEEYDHNELILGTKDAMYSTVGTVKFKNIIDATIYIPDDYTKARKYYYGVIRYLEHKGIAIWEIKFAGSNQSEITKANSILETIKRHDTYLHEENEIMSKTEYVEDVTGIYDYSPFYMENIKLCMEDAEAFARVSKGMSERTKMSIEITVERLKREGITLP